MRRVAGDAQSIRPIVETGPTPITGANPEMWVQLGGEH